MTALFLFLNSELGTECSFIFWEPLFDIFQVGVWLPLLETNGRSFPVAGAVQTIEKEWLMQIWVGKYLIQILTFLVNIASSSSHIRCLNRVVIFISLPFLSLLCFFAQVLMSLKANTLAFNLFLIKKKALKYLSTSN